MDDLQVAWRAVGELIDWFRQSGVVGTEESLGAWHT